MPINQYAVGGEPVPAVQAVLSEEATQMQHLRMAASQRPELIRDVDVDGANSTPTVRLVCGRAVSDRYVRLAAAELRLRLAADDVQRMAPHATASLPRSAAKALSAAVNSLPDSVELAGRVVTLLWPEVAEGALLHSVTLPHACHPSSRVLLLRLLSGHIRCGLARASAAAFSAPSAIGLRRPAAALKQQLHAASRSRKVCFET